MATAAERKRRYRARQRKGELVVPVVVSSETLNGLARVGGVDRLNDMTKETFGAIIEDLLPLAISARLLARRR